MKTRYLILTLLCVFAGEGTAQTDDAVARIAFGGVQPRISPDGDRIALSFQGAICTMPVEGGRLARLTRGEGWDVEPAWSPDGARIAFINSPGFAGGRLQVIDSREGGPVGLAAEIRGEGPLFFDGDGARILGQWASPGGAARLGWVEIATGKVEILEGAGPEDPETLRRQRIVYALSNAGDRILYALHPDLPGEQGGNNGAAATLWELPSAGGEPRKIVQFPARIFRICWDSGDKECYAVSNAGTAHDDIWRLPLEDTLRGARRITAGQADEDWPSLSRDGATLVHTDNARGATSIFRRDPVSGSGAEVAVSGIEFGEPTGSLRIEVLNGQGAAPAVARLSLKQLGGKYHAPVGALYRLTAGAGHFYASEATITLPAGEYELVSMRGPQYALDRRKFEVKASSLSTVEVALQRWSDMQSEGWYSGENHVHANYGYGAWYNTPETILKQCEGEDLNICNAVVANSDGDGVFDREFFRGEPDNQSTHDTILYWNQEFRSTLWGHMTLSNLAQLVEPIFTGFTQTTNPWDVPTNGDVAEKTRDIDGIASYTHPAANFLDLYDQPYAAKGLPVDAALGKIDTMDVMGNTYKGSLMLWYKLLNCGIRIPASAGTDCFLNRIPSQPPGWGRAYVKLPGALTYADWVEGQREGRAFVTNGPMLELAIDGATLGDTIELGEARDVKIDARARSFFPMEAVELVYNGEVAATAQLSADGKSAKLTGQLRLERTGWVALRASGQPAPHLIGNGLHAHTNPIYVKVAGSAPNAAGEAEYFLRWIDRLEADFEKRDRVPTDAARLHVRRQFEGAREFYRGLVERGKAAP